MSSNESRPNNVGEGWTRIATPAGRYEYQFQGRSPAVRNGRYEDSTDYQFLLLDAEGWLYRIPVRVAAEAEAELKQAGSSQGGEFVEVARVAAAQLRAGLQKFQPRQNAPFEELDQFFAVDVVRARELHTHNE
jgi:hypothetical protein